MRSDASDWPSARVANVKARSSGVFRNAAYPPDAKIPVESRRARTIR